MDVTNIPHFILKLWMLVEEPDTDHLVKWDQNGKGFIITDEVRFAKEVLPKYFKHSNMNSFVRQLNSHDFHKVQQFDVISSEKTLQFSNVYFQRAMPDLLQNIRRKSAITPRPGPAVTVVPPGAGSVSPVVTLSPQQVNSIIRDVTFMQSKQKTMNHQLQSLKRENEVLWEHVTDLRTKHLQQQTIVNKLINFLAALASNRQKANFSMLRPKPLEIMGSDSFLGDPPSYTSIPPSDYVVNELPSVKNDQREPLLVQDISDQLSPEMSATVEPMGLDLEELLRAAEINSPLPSGTSSTSSSTGQEMLSIAPLFQSVTDPVMRLSPGRRPITRQLSEKQADILAAEVGQVENKLNSIRTAMSDHHYNSSSDSTNPGLSDLFNIDSSIIPQAHLSDQIPFSPPAADPMLTDATRPGDVTGHELVQYQPDEFNLFDMLQQSDSNKVLPQSQETTTAPSTALNTPLIPDDDDDGMNNKGERPFPQMKQKSPKRKLGAVDSESESRKKQKL